MTKPVRAQQFNNMIVQVAAGNINTLFLCADEDCSTFMVQSGWAVVPVEENKVACEDDEIEEILDSQAHLYQNVPSIPYSIDFNIPVYKVACGDLFSGLLTVEG